MLELQNRHIWQMINNSDVTVNLFFTQDGKRQENEKSVQIKKWTQSLRKKLWAIFTHYEIHTTTCWLFVLQTKMSCVYVMRLQYVLSLLVCWILRAVLGEHAEVKVNATDKWFRREKQAHQQICTRDVFRPSYHRPTNMTATAFGGSVSQVCFKAATHSRLDTRLI